MYEILSVKEYSTVYYVVEKCYLEEDLKNHSELVAEKGYATQAVH
ncbi:hypothetical protein [Epilithonimonas lactis]|nr:hypothetical protein [Epilithonimonas lactis]